MSDQYRVIDRHPTPGEHRELATSVGWADHFDSETVPRSLESSLFGVVVTDAGDQVVGMGRLVGDGVHYFYVQDVVVHPDHESAGIGSRIIERLLQWTEDAGGPSAFVGLFASDEAVALYEKHGFGTGGMTGMHRDAHAE